MFGFLNRRGRQAQASAENGKVDFGVLAGQSVADLLGGTNSSKMTVTADHALGVVTVFACIAWRAKMMGHLPLKLMKKSGKVREPVENHSISLAIEEPHEELNRVDFISSLVAAKTLYNVAYCQVVRNLIGEVIGFIPIHPSRVERVKEGDKCVYRVDGKRTLQREEILHFKGLTLDGVNSIPFSRFAQECIGLAMALDKDAGLTFSENVRFPNLLVSENEVPEKAYDRIVGWLRKSEGPLFGRLKTTLLDAGVKPWEPQRNYKELEFDGTRLRQQLAICQMFGVPPHKVGILDNAIKANIEAQQIEAVTDVIAPDAVLFEAEFRRCLTRKEKLAGFYFNFNLNALLRGTMKDRAEFYKTMTGIRAFSPNEVRALEEMNPYEGGDEYFGPMNDETVKQTTNRKEKDEI